MRTVIVVDDDPITRLDLSQMLAELDYSVCGAVSDGFDAVELSRRLHPDIVLMDINMPVFDGLGAAESILSEKLAGSVIIISGYSDRANIARAAHAGVAGWIVKPVEKQQLLPVLEIAAVDVLRLEKLRAENAQLLQKLDDLKLVDRAKALLAEQRSVSESEAYRQMQVLAMEKRCSIAAIAKRIVDGGSDKKTVDEAKLLLMRKKGVSESAAYKSIAAAAKERGVPLVSIARSILAER